MGNVVAQDVNYIRVELDAQGTTKTAPIPRLVNRNHRGDVFSCDNWSFYIGLNGGIPSLHLQCVHGNYQRPNNGWIDVMLFNKEGDEEWSRRFGTDGRQQDAYLIVKNCSLDCNLTPKNVERATVVHIGLGASVAN